MTYKKIPVPFGIMLVLLALGTAMVPLFSAGASSTEGSFTETFGNSTYIDQSNTTAWILETNSYAQIPTVNKGQISPAIDYSTRKRAAHVAWTGTGPASSGFKEGIYSQRVDMYGNPLWTEEAFVGPGGDAGSKVDSVAVATYRWADRTYSIVAFRDDVGLKFQQMYTWAQNGVRRITAASAYSYPDSDWSLDNYDLLFSKNSVDGVASSIRMDTIDRDDYYEGSYTWATWVDGSGIRLQRFKLGATFVEPFGERVIVRASGHNPDVVSSDGQKPDVAVDANNNAYVVWSEWNGSVTQIYMQKYDSGGVPAWAQPKILGIGSTPRIDIDPADGLLYVVGSTKTFSDLKYSWEVSLWVRDLDGNGPIGKWGLEYTVASGADPTAFSAPNPTVASNKDTNSLNNAVYVAWYDVPERQIQVQGLIDNPTLDVIRCTFGPGCLYKSSEIGPVMFLDRPLAPESTPSQPRFDLVQSGWEPRGSDPIGSNSLYLVWHEELNGDTDVYLQNWDSFSGDSPWKVKVNSDTVEPGEAVLQSLTRDTVSGNILRATVTAVSDTPVGTDINYYLSVNGGTAWEAVTLSQEHVFAATGSDLRWKVVMSTDDNAQSPKIHDLTVSYSTELDMTSPATPVFGAALGGGNPPSNVAIPFISVSSDTEYLSLYMSQTQGMLGSMIYSNLPVSDGGFIFDIDSVGMEWDMTYYFTLRAVDAAGNESTNTLQKSIVMPKDPIGDPVTPDGVPSAPEYNVNIGHISGEPISIVFGFTGISDNAVYLRIYRSTIMGKLGVLQATGIPAYSTGYSVGIIEIGLEWNQTYYFTVRAVNSSAQESTNISVSPLILADEPITQKPPTNVVVSMTSPKNGTVVRNGDTLLIEWRADGVTSAYEQLEFDISIMNARDETLIKQITNNVVGNAKSFAWKVPDTFDEGIFRVRVGATWLLNGTSIGATASLNNPYFVIVDAGYDGPDLDNKGCLPNGTLMKVPNDSKIYVINDCQKEWIRSADEFNRAGYAWENVQDVAEDIVLMHPDIARRIAKLFRFSDSPDIFVVRDGQLHRIPDAGTLTARRLRWEDVEVISREDMQGVPRGFDFVPEGALLRATGSPDVYIVKYMGNKQFKRLILNPSVFNSYGHLRWEDIRDVGPDDISAFPEATLVRVVGTNQIYRLSPNGDIGVRQRINEAKAIAMGLDIESVYEINDEDFRNYTEGATLE